MHALRAFYCHESKTPDGVIFQILSGVDFYNFGWISAATIFETSVIYAGSGQISSLAHHNRNVIVLFVFGERNDTAVNGSSVNKKGNNSFFHVVRVLDVDIIVGIAVVSVDIISAAIRRNAGIDTQTIPVGANAKDVQRSMPQYRSASCFLLHRVWERLRRQPSVHKRKARCGGCH